ASSGKRAMRSAGNAVNTAPPQNNVNRIFTENTASREIKTQPAPTTPSDMGSTANEDSPASNEQAGAASVSHSGNTCTDAKVSTLERRNMFERMEPAMRKLKRHLSGPHPGVIELAVPLTVGYKQRATTVAEAIHRAMEWLGFGSNHTPAGDLAILEELINTDSLRTARLTRLAHSVIAYLVSKLRQDHNVFSKWTRTHTSGDGKSDTSSDSDTSSSSSASKGAGSRPEPRRVPILPAAADNSEATLDDSSNNVEDDDDVYVSEWYAGLFAAIEVRQDSLSDGVDNAELQLSKHCRRIFCAQLNRRFVWGLTICGSFVRVYLFGSNFVLVSNTMNICTKAGRGEAIRLFVNLSFTEDHRLGFDPTIKHLHGLDCWEITVPGTAATDSTDRTGNSGGTDGSSGSSERTFYSNHMVVEVSHLFGRLTRCFLATDKKPTKENRIRSKNCTVFIKDAWTEVADSSVDKDARDEVAHLRKITQTPEHYPELAGTYPVLGASGRVEFQSCSDHTFAKGTTRSVLSDLFDDVRVGEKI
ncbi:hypothetical protein LPJ66_003135, partial [Kickxella alabastrina]